MKRFFLSGKLLFFCILMLYAKASAGESEKEITVMIYMCGSNLESDTGAASRDLKEIMRSGYHTEQVNVIAMTGGSRKWWSGLDAEETAIYDLSGRRPARVYGDGLLDMGESSTLSRFLDFGYQHYPAQRYALIIWDHGAGPLGGVCLDYLSNGDTMDMRELAEALSQSFVSGQKLDWIGFDACMMAAAETACILEPYAGYMIASEETEPGDGWNYAFLKTIHEDKNGADTAVKIIDDYFSECGEQNITLSCVDLKEMDTVRQKMNSFFWKIAGKLSTDSFPAFSNACQAVKSYGRVGTDSQSYDLVDLCDLVKQYCEQDADGAQELLQALHKAIVYNRCSGEGSNGLAIYHPYYNKEGFRSAWREQYPALSLCEGYTRYLNRFSAIWLGEPIADWEELVEADVNVETTPDPEQENTVELQLTQEQAQQYVTGQVIVLEENEEGYHQVSTSDEITLHEDGSLTAGFMTQKLYAVDAQGNILVGPVSYDLQDGTWQVTACCLNIAAQQMINIKLVCSKTEENPLQMKIDSIFVYDSLLDNYTNRIDLNWMDYDCIFFPEYYKEETYDTVLKAYQEWELTGYSMKQNIFSGTDWHFELKNEENAGDLYVTVQVTDTQVNTLSSQPVAVG